MEHLIDWKFGTKSGKKEGKKKCLEKCLLWESFVSWRHGRPAGSWEARDDARGGAGGQ